MFSGWVFFVRCLPPPLSKKSSAQDFAREDNVSVNGLSPPPPVIRMYSLRIVIRRTKGSANDYSLVFCPRRMFSLDQKSSSIGNKRSLCRCVISTILKTVVIPWLWLFWPIVRLFHHWILTSSQAFPIFTRFPCAKFFACATYANDLRWTCFLLANERYQASNLTFVLQSSPS